MLSFQFGRGGLHCREGTARDIRRWGIAKKHAALSPFCCPVFNVGRCFLGICFHLMLALFSIGSRPNDLLRGHSLNPLLNFGILRQVFMKMF